MFSIKQTCIVMMSLGLAPAVLGSAVHRRTAGDNINFDIKVWSKNKADSMIATDFADPTKNLTATSNDVSYTAPGTPPDVKKPSGTQDEYFIIGQLHFNQVPGTTADPNDPMKQPRKMYLFTGQQKPGEDAEGQKAVYCDVTFDNVPGFDDLHWYLRSPNPFDSKKPDDMIVVCTGDSGVVNEGDTVETPVTNSDGSTSTSTGATVQSSTMAK